MLVVFDSCVWVSELGLSSSAGSAVRYFLNQNGAVVAVPEVVRLEVAKILARNLLEAKEQVRAGHRQLLAVFGELTDIVLPSDDDIANQARTLIDRVDVPTKEIPFSLDSARMSLAKVIDGNPPSGPKNQQFKDGVIWADCLALLNDDDVHLVSTDKGFFEQRTYGKGLANELLAEANAHPCALTLHSGLNSLLQQIRSNVTVEPHSVVDALLGGKDGGIQPLLEQHGFALHETPQLTTDLFFTERADVLYAHVRAVWRCEDTTPLKRPDATLTVKGQGTLNIVSNELSELFLDNVRLKYTDEDGEPASADAAYARVSMTLGVANVRHSLRLPSANY